MHAHKPTISDGQLTVRLSVKLLGRFFSKVTVDHESDCWEWQGHLNPSGYGRFSVNPKTYIAHRIAYAAFVAPIPVGFGKGIPQIDHLCRNRVCVNPAHLELVSAKVNVRRSDSAAANNARKTHCIRGHVLGGANLYVTPQGYRNCRVCALANERKREQKKRRAAGCKVGCSERTHCPQGHPYSGDNLYVRPSSGKRHCRACDREQHRNKTAAARRAKELAALPAAA